MTTITAIPTIYAGIQFRSRLEARWAVFMDALGVKWEYEPEGFTDGTLCYLPDFWLPNQNCYLEIKPDGPWYEDCKKADLITHTGKEFYFAIGRPIRRDETSHGGSLMKWPDSAGCEEKLDFVVCGSCNLTAIVWLGLWDEMCCCSDAIANREAHDAAVFAANNHRFGKIA